MTGTPRLPDRPRPTPTITDPLIGPLWTIDDVLAILDSHDRHHVHAMVTRGDLLQVRTNDDWALYPAFQFDWSDVHPPISAALRHLRRAPVDGWTIATWFCQPAAELANRSPREWIYDRNLDNTIAIQLAADTAARWSTT
ncbi:hypothetical protein [Cellulomonas sp. Y8]|uniref:hypothetical protein n=1 Tax=Cellulomonas sp. Y8 TaxID=2591145 RepID=UPI0011C9A8AB|nr:hypothetical protein [Cellulomonas sp. Y8]